MQMTMKIQFVKICRKYQYKKAGKKLSKENFKSKREIGADNRVITTRFNNC
jgi:hypothetical protein